MAGDWIKMRCNIDTDWRVFQIAGELNLPELHVVGCLWKIWTWADQHTIDGNAICVTDVTLDRITLVTGFANAMRNAGWLEGENGSLTFPNFIEHNGKTAKKRAETNKRVAKHRNAKLVTDVTQKALPEKRREEKRITRNTNTYPTVEEVAVYLAELNETKFTAQQFHDYYEMLGWKSSGKPIKSWKAAVRTWRNRSQSNGTPSKSPEELEADRKAARKAESDRLYPVMGGRK